MLPLLHALIIVLAQPGGAVTPPANAATPATADQPSPQDVEQARGLYKAGSDAYRDGKYEIAIDAFEAALELTRRPSIIFALAQANRLQYFIDGDADRLEAAVELYREYYDTVSEDDSAGRREHSAKHLAALVPLLQSVNEKRDNSVGRVIVSANVEGAIARIGDGPLAVTPATFEVQPGPIQVTVEAKEHVPQTLDTVAVGGSPVAVNVELVPVPGTLTVKAPTDAEVIIDGRSMGLAPIAPLQIPPGAHQVAVLASGRKPFVETVEVQRAEQVTLTAEPAITGQRIAAWSLFGVAAALAGTTALTTGVALSKEVEAQQLETEWQNNGLSVEDARDYQTLVTEVDDWTTVSIVLGVSAVATAGLGLALFLSDTPAAPKGPTLVPTITNDGVGVSGAFSF